MTLFERVWLYVNPDMKRATNMEANHIEPSRFWVGCVLATAPASGARLLEGTGTIALSLLFAVPHKHTIRFIDLSIMLQNKHFLCFLQNDGKMMGKRWVTISY